MKNTFKNLLLMLSLATLFTCNRDGGIDIEPRELPEFTATRVVIIPFQPIPGEVFASQFHYHRLETGDVIEEFELTLNEPLYCLSGDDTKKLSAFIAEATDIAITKFYGAVSVLPVHKNVMYELRDTVLHMVEEHHGLSLKDRAERRRRWIK